MLTSYSLTMLLCMFSLCYLTIKSEGSPLRTSFAIAQAVIIMWLLFALRERLSLTFAEILLNIRISLICINFAAPLWLITILFFTERLSRKNLWFIPAILMIPLILSVPLLFPESSTIFKLYIKEIHMDEQARILFENWGYFENATTLYATICSLFGFYFLLIFLRKSNSIILIEKITALVFWCSPIAFHCLGSLINAPFDLTPVTFSFWGMITLYLSFQRQFFNAVPSLVWNIFNITRESMVVLSADGSVNVNKTFTEVFGSRGSDFLKFADELSDELSEYIHQKRDITGLEAKKNDVYYEISITNVINKRNRVIGQLITISDVSETKQLTLTEERARISSNLHDNMGNCLIASINNLNTALLQQTLEEAAPFIDSSFTSTVASLMTLRRIVEGLSPINFRETEFIPLINSVINRISATGIQVDLQLTDNLEKLSIPLKAFVYNTCQESLTNAVIHGKAKRVVMKLAYSADKLKFNILDDGYGCKKISKNNGLTAMENHIKTLNGRIEFVSTSSGGFGIYTEIPIKTGELK